MMIKNTFYLVLALLLLSGCQQNNGWKMVWSEEFDYEGLPDSSIWNYDTKGNEWGWGNNELQYYTHLNSKNTWVSKGSLKINALIDSVEGKSFTSARLTTRDKVGFKYGRIEVKAKLPKGKGLWPAIWMLGANIDTVGWPMCGEIDIMEFVGYQPDSVYATIHSDTYNHMKNTQKMKSLPIKEPEAFNIYAIEWSTDKIDFYCNDKLYNTILNERKSVHEWPFDKEFFLLLNVAVGGNWGGKHGIDTTVFPATMEVDYVRLYKK